jgi:hypothetical protein
MNKLERYYVNWNEPMYEIRDRKEHKVVASYGSYGEAKFLCDRKNAVK